MSISKPMLKKIRITTKTGDKGTTRLFSGEKVPKASPRLDALGDIDELASILGIARCHARKPRTRQALLELQKDLFVIGAEIATTTSKLARLPRRVDEAFLKTLEGNLETLHETVPLHGGFVVPGADLSSAYLDYGRAVARRCERKIAALLTKKEILNPLVLVWMNRLSDYLYLTARSEENRPIPVKE